MLEMFEEARSIRRKTKREGKTVESEDHTKVNEKAKLEKEIEELIASEKMAQVEVEQYTTKVNEIKRNIRNILYNAELGLEEKARKVAEMKSRQENYEFIVKQATSRWARITNKRESLERELELLIKGK